MPSAFPSPPDYHRIRVMQSFEELSSSRFADGVNAMCWPRTLPGDFGEIVRCLQPEKGITTVDDEGLCGLPLSPAGCVARDMLLRDQEWLRALDLAPVLDCINGYHHDEEQGPVPTHVQSYHADSATVEADTWLCTYHGPSSEGLRNEDAIRRVDVPETRTALLRQFGGEDGDDFHEFLNDHFYDLHYVPLPGAQPYSFGIFNLWRIATEYPGSPVPACIHRAPATLPGQPPRLLLIC